MSTAIHRGTPSLQVNDSRGLAVRRIAYLRTVVGETPVALVTRQQYDVAGRLVTQWDPRLTVAAQTDMHNLSGEPLFSHHVDGGRTVRLIGLARETLQVWDGRGTRLRYEYNSQQRLIAVHERAAGEPEQTTERIFFGGSSPEATTRNACGRVIEHLDPAGQLTISGYDLNGQPLTETRRFLNTSSTPHWTPDPEDNEPQLEPERFATSHTYDAIGASLSRLDARSHLQSMTYNVAGQLSNIALQPARQPQTVVYHSPSYNAHGQLESQTYGNGTVDTATYDPADGRVVELKTQSATGQTLQHSRYTYDQMGNVLKIVDLTFTPRHFANRRITNSQDFRYDSLRRLIYASGCEAQVDPGHPGLPDLSPIDDSLLRNYSQNFSYNANGGMTLLSHHSDHPGQSKTLEMVIDPQSNRALSKDGGEPDFANSFDRCGNQILLQRGGQPLLYNLRNQLLRCTTVARVLPAESDHEQFDYGADGKRLRVLRTTLAKNAALIAQIRHLPGLELHDETDQALEVIVIDAAPRPIRCLYWARGNPGIEDYQVRYSHGDHLGSCNLETGMSGLLISRERFHAFGTTASWASRSVVEADYKTVRYSGKKMDASGMYCYGLRYYAPWLRHWIGPDPLGNVDGLNRYLMVRNNPMNFVDEQGAMMTPPPLSPGQVAINVPSTSSSRRSSIESSTAQAPDTPALVNNPGENPPGKLPPKPEQSWGEWGKGMALAAVNSRVGLALLPVGTSSPANAAIASTVLTLTAQITLNAAFFNPGWSPPGTWDPAGDGALPPADVTQGINRAFTLANASITAAGTVAGMILGPVVGGYVDELRGTKAKAEKKSQAGKWIDTIDRLIAEQSLLDEVTVKAQTSLREQVLEVEASTGITWQTMGMLEKITRLRPENISESHASSRRGSISSQSSGGAFQRKGINRIPLRKTNGIR